MQYIYIALVIFFLILLRTGIKKYNRTIISIPSEPSDRKALLLRLFPQVGIYYRDVTWGKVRQAHVKPEILESNTVLFKSLRNGGRAGDYVSSVKYTMIENADFYVFMAYEAHLNIFMTPKRKFQLTNVIRH